MTAEAKLLRDAAVLMRDRAESAIAGPWEVRRDGMFTYVRSASVKGWQGEVAEVHTPDEAWPDFEHVASWHPTVALAVADWLDREARRVGSHAITTYKVREDWYAYSCVTCGHSGSTSKAGLATWQEHHASVRLVADDAAIAVARAYLQAEPA